MPQLDCTIHVWNRYLFQRSCTGHESIVYFHKHTSKSDEALASGLRARMRRKWSLWSSWFVWNLKDAQPDDVNEMSAAPPSAPSQRSAPPHHCRQGRHCHQHQANHYSPSPSSSAAASTSSSAASAATASSSASSSSTSLPSSSSSKPSS